jgi:predicted lysophospholipase L1 biosynthesis ABC-type transport system permease subunit
VGSGLALLAAWALIRFVFELPFHPPLVDLGALALGTLALTAALAGAGGRTTRLQSPLAALRDAELSGTGVFG